MIKEDLYIQKGVKVYRSCCKGKNIIERALLSYSKWGYIQLLMVFSPTVASAEQYW